jgi:hypothetical protein
METLFRKVKKGKRTVYEPTGYGSIPDISDGIWLCQSHDRGKSQTSLLWRVGDLKRPVDVVTHAALVAFNSELIKYLMQLGDVESEEYKDAKELLGSCLTGPVRYDNISAYDLCSLFLRKIALELEEGTPVSLGSLMFDFRNTKNIPGRDTFHHDVKLLYEFVDYLKERGVKVKI